MRGHYISKKPPVYRWLFWLFEKFCGDTECVSRLVLVGVLLADYSNNPPIDTPKAGACTPLHALRFELITTQCALKHPEGFYGKAQRALNIPILSGCLRYCGVKP